MLPSLVHHRQRQLLPATIDHRGHHLRVHRNGHLLSTAQPSEPTSSAPAATSEPATSASATSAPAAAEPAPQEPAQSAASSPSASSPSAAEPSAHKREEPAAEPAPSAASSPSAAEPPAGDAWVSLVHAAPFVHKCHKSNHCSRGIPVSVHQDLGQEDCIDGEAR